DAHVTRSTVRQIANLLPDTPEFTILASLKIRSTTSASSILSFESEDQRILLEVDYHGRRRELRLHYLHEGNPHTESFQITALADKQWHQLAITLTTNFVQVFIDCALISERQMPNIDIIAMSGDDDSSLLDNMKLWLAQRNQRGTTQLQGAMEYLKLVMYANGFTEQCPNANVACPTCSQFHGLEQFVHDLHSHIEALNLKIAAAESRISELEQCECMNSCEVDGTHYRDGESWHPDDCSTCTCRGGKVTCEEAKCPAVECANPVKKEGECCHYCLRSCQYGGIKYQHGETFNPKECFRCICEDGVVDCEETDEVCPELNCPLEDQISASGQCCKFCREADHCAAGNNCHADASCINMKTRYTCKCNEGYTGDGVHCEDKNECVVEGGADGHHCMEHSDCINLPGDYRCECHPGFNNTNQYECQEVNECTLDPGICGERAQCTNTDGSYLCECMRGYEGTPPLSCTPVCLKPCENGGECIAPDLCSCPNGFTGNRCEIDIDECKERIAECHENSECVNLRGSYQCKCREGYYSIHPNNQRGLLCVDVDECAVLPQDRLCPKGSVCRNTPGSYRCDCPPGSDSATCRLECKYEGQSYSDGQSWSSAYDACSTCKCKGGRVFCSAVQCDCRNSAANDLNGCCPQCAHSNKRCRHQTQPELSFRSGQEWTHGCQTCQCVNGEIDCWRTQCPELSCSPTVIHEGECCPRCAQPDTCSSAANPIDSDPQESCNLDSISKHKRHGNDCVDCQCMVCHSKYMLL
ncbi:hypothetical protein CAPTEDRAFT_147203, partial [Capitella teleta]